MDLCTFLEPVENLVLDEPPEPPLALSQGMSGDVTKARPTDEGSAVHTHDGRRLGGVENLDVANLPACCAGKFDRVGNPVFRNIHIRLKSWCFCKTLLPAWVTNVIPVQSKSVAALFLAVMTQLCHDLQ